MEKWKLADDDIDMTVMNHQFIYEVDGRVKNLSSSLVVKGDNQVHTPMSKTVGYPLGIAVKLILQGNIGGKGVQIPTTEEFYNPILKELDDLGISFAEEQG